MDGYLFRPEALSLKGHDGFAVPAPWRERSSAVLRRQIPLS